MALTIFSKEKLCYFLKTNRTEELYTKLFEELAAPASADNEQINKLYDQVREQFYKIRELRTSENAFIDRCEAEKINALKKA